VKRLIRLFRMMTGGLHFRYVGDLPTNYPLPGTEFFYRGEYGHIMFYCIHVRMNGEEAELMPVVSWKGREDLVKSLETIFSEIKINDQWI